MGITLAVVARAAISSHWDFLPKILVIFFRFLGERGSIEQRHVQASMENFHPLRRTPSHADVLNSAHCCTELPQDCAELGAQEIAPKFIVKLNFVYLFYQHS